MDWLFSALGHWLKGTILGAVFGDLQPAMVVFLALGVLGVALLVISMLLDGLFDIFEFGDGPLSLTTISAFVSLFGFGGLTASASGLGATASTFVGVAVGLLAAVAAYFITRSLKTMEGQGHEESSFVGRTAVVTIPIPVDGYGEIAFAKGGDRITRAARSHEPLASGVRVRIDTVLSSSSVLVVPEGQEIDTPSHSHENLK